MNDESPPPPCHPPLLTVLGNDPFNAEPPTSTLVEFPITPHELVYCRNHGPIRDLTPQLYTISVSGLGLSSLQLSIQQLKSNFQPFSVEAVLQCAGNRRNEMTLINPVNGLLWCDGTIANCKWTGISLRDVLLYAGCTTTPSDDLHVSFASHATACQHDSYYGASIPLSRALDADAQVMLAFEMNDDPLSPHHGGPLRLVVPGFLGARWVKWLDTIIVGEHESPNYYQQRDYKVLPPNIETTEQATDLWELYPPITTMPLNSVIGSVTPLSSIPTTTTTTVILQGYATHGHTSQVTKIEVSSDKGRTWHRANVTYDGGKWGWTLWEATLHLHLDGDDNANNNDDNDDDGVVIGRGKVHFVSRAQDADGVYQSKEGTWNIRGMMWCAWGKYSLSISK